jgi:glyoxylase-like metal-dependent hydrolase (beta-lactamase superfamily II)
MRLPDAAGYRIDHLALGTLTFDPGVLLPDEGVTVPVTALLLRGNGTTVLIDAGSGIYDPALPGTELLDTALAELGVSIDDVDTLVLTHMDGDHAGGALLGTWPDDVRAAFKRVVILDEALDWWRARTDPNLGRGLVAALERDGVLEPVASGHEFAPHLRLESAPGHRPGHAAVWVGDGFVHGADILHVVEHVANPAWDYYYDSDVALALQTRQEWIDRLIETGTPVLFAHIAARGRIVPGPAWQPEQ